MKTSSFAKLRDVHSGLVSVVCLARQRHLVPFEITCGPRTLAEQVELKAQGKSRTLKSKHLIIPELGVCTAVDVAMFPGGVLSWEFGYYHDLAGTVKKAAGDLGVSIIWGGDWPTFKDGCHYELEEEWLEKTLKL